LTVNILSEAANSSQFQLGVTSECDHPLTGISQQGVGLIAGVETIFILRRQLDMWIYGDRHVDVRWDLLVLAKLVFLKWVPKHLFWEEYIFSHLSVGR